MMIHSLELEKAMLQAKANTYQSIEKLLHAIPDKKYEVIAAVCDSAMNIIKEYEDNLKDYLGIKEEELDKWLKQVL